MLPTVLETAWERRSVMELLSQGEGDQRRFGRAAEALSESILRTVPKELAVPTKSLAVNPRRRRCLLRTLACLSDRLEPTQRFPLCRQLRGFPDGPAPSHARGTDSRLVRHDSCARFW